MQQINCKLLILVVSALGAAVLFRATAPPAPDGTASVTAVAIPRTVVVGEWTRAYGSATNGFAYQVYGRFVVCAAADCVAMGTAVVPVTEEWHDVAGGLAPRAIGPLSATWLIAEADDEAGGRATAVRSVSVEAVEPESVRNARR